MDRKNLGYSSKNIPLPSRNSYVKRLIEKTETFLRNMRWKALFFEQPDAKGKIIDTYGFKSIKTPPQMERLKAFETDMYDMIGKIEFSHQRNDFLRKLDSDVKEIRKSGNVFVSADKSTNLYELSADEYKKMLRDNVTKEYKEDRNETKRGIDHQAKLIALELEIANRVEAFAPKDAYITLKDHKDDFRINPSCRLINPAKGELGKVSKEILQGINTQVRNLTGLRQWRNTAQVIKWFKPLATNLKFMKFDIENFYPSITEALFDDNYQSYRVNIRECRRNKGCLSR